MAETRATLRVDGFLPRDITEFDYQFNRPIDPDNQVAGRARGGKITVTVKNRKDGNNELLAWLLDTTTGKKGEIIKLDNEDKRERTIRFKNGYCVDYIEKMNKDGHTEKIIISSQDIGVLGGEKGPTKYGNDWL